MDKKNPTLKKFEKQEEPKILQAMFAEATVGIFVVNASGEIVKSNPYSETLFGYEKNELIGKKIEILLPESFRKRHVGHRENYHKNPTPRTMGANLELFGLRKDATRFPLQISLSHMKIEGETYAIAYISDDSFQKNILNELRENKKRLDEAQKLAQFGSFERDLEKGENIWSEELFRIFGIEPLKIGISDEQFSAMVHPNDLEVIRKNHEKIIRDKKGMEFGYRIISPTKGLRYLEGRRDVKLDEKGNVVKIFGLLQDVTELREARKINEDISKIVDQSLNEIYIFDADTLAFIQVNKGALKNIGYSLEEMRKITPVDIKPNFEMEGFLEVMEPLKQGNKTKLLFETVHERKDKTTYPVEVHLQLSRLGNRPAYVAIILDITERKMHEKTILEHSESLEKKIKERTQKLRESETKLKAALAAEQDLGELKSRFVSMASHEFRTPLTSILSSSALARRYEKEEQQEKRLKHLKRIDSSVRNLTTILNDFLSLEKLESGKVRYEPTEFDLEYFITQIIDEVTLTAKPGQEVIFKNRGSKTVKADEHLLKNILINLLSNGFKYSPENKPIELTTDNHDSKLKITVRDYGIGIPETEQKHMFTRFFRAKNASTIQGTGLGLTIVSRYLNMMNGSINFESKEGEGTTFFVEIPL